MLRIRSLRLPVLFLAFATFGALAAHAAPQGRMPDSAQAEKRIDRFVGRMEKDLKLTPDQSAKIRAILRKDPVAPPMGMEGGMHGPGMGFGGQGEFIAQLRASSVDTAALDRSFEERVTQMRARHASMVAKFAEVAAVLTPEQRNKAADLLEKRQAKMEKHHRRWGAKGARGAPGGQEAGHP